MDNSFDIKSIFSSPGSETSLDDVMVIDTDWVKSRFMVPDESLSELDRTLRYMTNTDKKFTDTSLGGNIMINPKPQFTRYCDPRAIGVIGERDEVSIYNESADIGMGDYYSRAIDDNQQIVYLQFGLPKFNSLSDFFLRAVDYEDSVIANTGRSPLAYEIGQGLGVLMMLAAFPLVSIIVWSVKYVAKILGGDNVFKYYYLEPQMHMYWGTVSTIATMIATELGILIPTLMPPKDSKKTNIGLPVELDKEDMEEMAKLLPGLVDPKTNYIDVFAVATKAQYRANRRRVLEYQALKEGKITPEEVMTRVPKENDKELKEVSKGVITEVSEWVNYHFTFADYLKSAKPIFNKQGDLKNTVNNDTKECDTPDPNLNKRKSDGTIDIPEKDDPMFDKIVDSVSNWGGNFISTFDSAVRGGGAYAIFGVNYTGPASESFSNSVTDIETGGQIKQLARKSRDLKFNLAGGNVIGGVDIAGHVKDLMAGALDSVTYGLSSVVSTLTGGGYIDIPKKWDDSTFSKNSTSYKMELRSVYGDTISRMTNLYVPLSMILAGVMPLATGKSSYTSPYLASLFSKGIENSSLGMITSVTITRGTSNLAFNKERHPLGIDIEFTYTDFSNIITSPVPSSLFQSFFNTSVEDGTPLSEYISVIGSRDILKNRYSASRADLKLSRKAMESFGKGLSPFNWSMRLGAGLENTLGVVTGHASITGQYQ